MLRDCPRGIRRIIGGSMIQTTVSRITARPAIRLLIRTFDGELASATNAALSYRRCPTNRRCRPALAPQFHLNHYVLGRRQGSTLAPQNNEDSRRAVPGEVRMKINQAHQSTNNRLALTAKPSQSIFPGREMTSGEQNALFRFILYFRTRNMQ